ncbi:MAG: hypothetical protein U9R57_04820 [Thermodesulfobacteriota bacterium]|nr:hypothetical protein [Thermodesulfobacteriota bacterium]
MKNTCLFLMKFFTVFFCLSFFSCAILQKPEETILSKKEIVPPEPGEIAEPEIDPNAPFKISNVAISHQSFSPAKGEAVTISWHISRPSKALVQIFDPDMLLIRELVPENTGNPGLCEVTWGGKDPDGNIIPDEAYFFTIEANDYKGELTHYDPITFSGGKNFDCPVEFDSSKQLISYNLAQDSRVLIRTGITHGPLLKTIVNWEPRLVGVHEEPWDGKDASGVINAADQKGFTMMSDAVTLPENSILASGNKEYTYVEYKHEISSDRPIKEERPRIVNDKTQPDLPFNRPVQQGDAPKFYLKLPENLQITEQGYPIVSGKLPIKIYLDEKVKKSATERRYEIICYVDYKFITEQEEGYSPSTWLWDTNNMPNGEHVLTVNVATLTGQVASASMKVMVQN